MADQTVYTLSRAWFDFCFENPEKINPNHSAIFFFAIEHCNRLGWKNKFGFPTQMTMDAIGIKKHQTYIKYFNELVEWGFFKLVEKSKNQYSANIISIQNAMPKNGKALDKAIINHRAKQSASIGQSTGQSNSSIDIPIYNNTNLPLVDEDAGELFKSEFKNSKYYRSLIEKEKFLPAVVDSHIDVFLDQKDAFNELKSKKFDDLCKNFYYWLPKYIRGHPDKEKNSGKKESKVQQILQSNDNLNRKFRAEAT